MRQKRRICFVTGTRAEFGLMRRTLTSIQQDKRLRLQLMVTGTHLDPACGSTIDEIRKEAWPIDSVVDWPGGDRTHASLARATAGAMAKMSDEFARLASDVVLVVGDRVEAFAAASVGSLSNRCVVHIHGGERATGQVDDRLRHAITKLSHFHLCATDEARLRLVRMGEDPWRVVKVGAPGLDGIVEDAAEAKGRRAEVVLLMHPWIGEDGWNKRFTTRLVESMCKLERELVLLMPNGDPGSKGIRQAIESFDGRDRVRIHQHLDRRAFLGLLRDASVLVGNSSSGIIEAASFGTRVIDIGPRQHGRLCGKNVLHVEAVVPKVIKSLSSALKQRPIKVRMVNPYGDGHACTRIVSELAKLKLNAKLLCKTIAY